MEGYGFQATNVVEKLLGELEKDDAEYAGTESSSPIGRPGDHYLNQISKRGYAEVPKNDAAEKKKTSGGGGEEKVTRVYTTVNVSSIRNIDSVLCKYDVKLRVYMVWQCDVATLGEKFAKHKEKANENGHYYSLNEAESIEMMKVLPCPMDSSMFYNATAVEEQDEYMGVRVYTFGVMVNRG